MKKIIPMAVIVCLGLAGWTGAGEHDHMNPDAHVSNEFKQMKQVIGFWKGTHIQQGKPDEEVRVEYSLTAGGSAILETLFPGTPHEMVSVYADEGGKLGMTHYCMMGNHPRLQLMKALPGELDFEMKDRGAIGSKEAHMHSLVIYFQDNDHMMQRWTGYENGKEKEATTFKLTRVQAKTTT